MRKVPNTVCLESVLGTGGRAQRRLGGQLRVVWEGQDSWLRLGNIAEGIVAALDYTGERVQERRWRVGT